jgi:L-fucose isomerase-like protein
MRPPARALVVPFSYPFYPRSLVDEQVERTRAALQELQPEMADTVFTRADALRARERVRIANPDLVIAVMVSWIEAPIVLDALRDWFGRPLLLWGHTTLELEGRKQTIGALVAAGVVKQTLADFGYPFEYIAAKPGRAEVGEAARVLLRAAAADTAMRDSRLGLIGYPALGMYTGTLDHIACRKLFGPEIVHADQYQIIRRMEKADPAEVAAATEELRGRVRLGQGITPADLETSSRMLLALRGIVREQEMHALTVKCQYELSQLFGFTPCVPLSVLGEELPVSCEGDLLTTLTEMLLHNLSGEIVSYADIHEVLADRVLVAACGFAPFALSEPADRAVSRWGWEAFNGVLSSSPLRQGPVTLARIARDGTGFKIHAATGRAVGQSDWNEVGCPRYPGADIVLDGSAEGFGQELASNHYALVFADVAAELEAYARWKGLRLIRT